MSYGQRVRLLALLAGCGVLLLLVRLTEFQLVDHRAWVLAAHADTASWRPVPGRRGRILDARGRVLAADDAGFDLVVLTSAWEGRRYQCASCGLVRFFLPGKETTVCKRCKRGKTKPHEGLVPADRRDLRRVARLLHVAPADLENRIDSAVRRTRERVEKQLSKLPERTRERHRRVAERDWGWRPQRIAREVPYEAAREVELHPEFNPAFRIATVHSRRNLGGPAFAHFLGVVREERQVRERPDGATEFLDVSVGASGLEARYEAELRGRPGWIRIMNDPVENRRRVLDRRAPLPGLDLELTVDREVQERALLALRPEVGAFVVIDARTGAVLALASSPTYEPAEHGRVFLRWKDREDAANSPLAERAARGWYAPGSILKPFTAVAGLEAGVAALDTVIECDGRFRDRRGNVLQGALKCNGTHGPVRLHAALEHSCNIYFQTLASRLDGSGQYHRFWAALHRFGFGGKTGVEVGVPAPLRHKRARDTWYNRIAASIGQGALFVTPAQIARGYAGLLTGSLPTLHLVGRVGGRARPAPGQPLGIPEAILAPIRAGLRDVARTGTAGDYGLDAWGIACKTGTAQVAGRSAQVYNAWVAGFNAARGGRPPIAFAMIVERTPLGGGEACGPRLREFFEYFYGGRDG